MEDIKSMLLSKVREEIFTRMGGTSESLGNDWVRIDWHGKRGESLSYHDDRFNTAGVPNWPKDDGAALKLCLEVLDKLNEKSPGKMWQLEFTDCCVSLTLLEYGGGIWTSFGADRRDSIGMSWIALEALRHLDEDK